MAFFVFLVVLIGGALVIILVGSAIRPRGPVIAIQYVGAPSSYQEQVMWLEALKSAGIHAHVENAMPSISYALPWKMRAIYPTEIWVRDEDYEGARAILGFDHAEHARRSKRTRLRRPR
jgi:hypothetical protein